MRMECQEANKSLDTRCACRGHRAPYEDCLGHTWDVQEIGGMDSVGLFGM